MSMIINPYLVQTVFLLQAITVPTAVAYSAARRLSSTYTGSLIRVRRSSDNAEQDIGYDGCNVLDESALTTFVGAGNGFVTTWYDQSGNGRNATQTVPTQQPRIIVNGVLQLEGTRPAILFDGIDDGLVAPSWGLITQPFSRHYVGVRKSLTQTSHWINSAEGNPNTAEYDYAVAPFDPNLNYFHAMYAGAAVGVLLLNNERAIFSSAYNNTSSYISKNGVLTIGFPGTQGFNGIRIGGFYNSNVFCSNVAMQEVIVCAENNIISTCNRQTIELSQGQFYNISVQT
jgi:hypothetical protein